MTNFHDWYKFHMGFSPEFVRTVAGKIGVDSDSIVLDPFCGSGTTPVELLNIEPGIKRWGVEAHPFLAWIAFNKAILPEIVYFILRDDPEFLRDTELLGQDIAALFEAYAVDKKSLKIPDLLIKESISPFNWHLLTQFHRAIVARTGSAYAQHNILLMALIQVATDVSNLRFAPEVTVCPKRAALNDTKSIPQLYKDRLSEIIYDLRSSYCFLSKNTGIIIGPHAFFNYCNRTGQEFFPINARNFADQRQENYQITHVITSPPYPNEKDYTRSTRLESVLLGFIKDPQDLTRIKQNLIPSNTKFPSFCYSDYKLASDPVRALAEQIEEKTKALGKTDGFSAKYPRTLLAYFGSMTKHLMTMRRALVPGAKLAYLLGDQASYHGTPVRTAELLGEIADTYGYTVDGIDLYKDRVCKTKTNGEQRIPENILYLTYRGYL